MNSCCVVVHEVRLRRMKKNFQDERNMVVRWVYGCPYGREPRMATQPPPPSERHERKKGIEFSRRTKNGG